MSNEEFIDHYEVMELSINASSETIEKMFRYLAPRLHPDTADSSDKERFNRLVEAYQILREPESRAAYDVAYRKNQQTTAELIHGSNSTVEDSINRHCVLSLFYAQRRRDMNNPGVGIIALEQILGCPTEILEFHIWYFREKGWVEREESGLLAITAAGVDEIESRSQRWATSDQMITDQSSQAAAPTSATSPADMGREVAVSS